MEIQKFTFLLKKKITRGYFLLLIMELELIPNIQNEFFKFSKDYTKEENISELDYLLLRIMEHHSG